MTKPLPPSLHQQSLHQRILSDIQDKIVSREWPPGHRIPFETDLALHYQCSRMTVNKVMSKLAQAGLIERRRKSGSYVAQPHAQSAILEIRDIRSEVEMTGAAYSFRLLHRAAIAAGSAERALMQSPLLQSLIAVDTLHLAGGDPFCLEQRLINLDVVPGAAQESFAQTSPGPWLMGQIPWSAAEHRVSAVSADAATADQLQIARRSACLVVERRTWDAEVPVTFVRLTYPAERHQLVANFTPSQPV